MLHPPSGILQGPLSKTATDVHIINMSMMVMMVMMMVMCMVMMMMIQ
jgi:hypothetical protein